MRYLFIVFTLSVCSCFAQNSDNTTTPRKIVSIIDGSSIKSEVDCEISLNFMIDEAGNLMSKPNVNRAGTTCTDAVLIEQVVNLVYRDLKYSKGSSIEKKVFKVKITGVPNT